MPNGSESCGTKRVKELIGVRPSIEADAKAVLPELAVDFGECRFEPCVVIIVRDDAPVAGFVAADIRRVGENEVDASGGNSC